jgi:Sec-independent protein translocase protein TatA
MSAAIFRNIWFKILLLVAGIIMLVFGAYKIYTAMKPSLPEGYKDALVEIGDRSTNLGNLFGEDLQQSLAGLEEKETAGNFTAAAKIVASGLAVVSDISSGTASLKTGVANFKSLSEKIEDSEVREKSLQLAGLLEQLVTHLEETANLEKQILEPIKKYYENLAAGKAATLPSNLSTIGAKITKEANSITDLGSQVITSMNELSDLLGISPSK